MSTHTEHLMILLSPYDMHYIFPDSFVARSGTIEAVNHAPLIVKFRGLYLVSRLTADDLNASQGIVWLPHPVIE